MLYVAVGCALHSQVPFQVSAWPVTGRLGWPPGWRATDNYCYLPCRTVLDVHGPQDT